MKGQCVCWNSSQQQSVQTIFLNQTFECLCVSFVKILHCPIQIHPTFTVISPVVTSISTAAGGNNICYVTN